MILLSSRISRRGVTLAPARFRGTSALLMAVAVTLTGCSLTPPDSGASSAEPTSSASTAPQTAPNAAPPAAAPNAPATTPVAPPVPGVGVQPASISVPTMGLDEPLIPLGIQSDGTMEVPIDYDDVGYFTGGGQPGGVGPTVIAAHVDSRSGPAVFFRLGEMVLGDRFTVTGINGTVFEYEVYNIEDHAKAQFPTVTVFGATPTDEVRLITCGGEYNEAIGRYVDNLVVFAARV